MKRIQCLAGLLLAFGALPLMARTLTVTDVEGDVVSLAFGDLDGKSYTIGVGYGATDGGADKYGWTSFSNNLVTVAADATTGTLTLPADLFAARAAADRHRHGDYPRGEGHVHRLHPLTAV